MLSERLKRNSSVKPGAPKNRAIELNRILRSWDEYNMCNNRILRSYCYWLRLGVAIPEGNTKMLGRRWRNAAWNWHWHADTEVFSLYWVLLLRQYSAIDCKTRHILAGVMASCPFQAALAKRRACSKGPVIKSNKDWAATSWSFEPLWGVQLRNLLFLWDCLNSRKQSAIEKIYGFLYNDLIQTLIMLFP